MSPFSLRRCASSKVIKSIISINKTWTPAGLKVKDMQSQKSHLTRKVLPGPAGFEQLGLIKCIFYICSQSQLLVEESIATMSSYSR